MTETKESMQEAVDRIVGRLEKNEKAAVELDKAAGSALHGIFDRLEVAERLIVQLDKEVQSLQSNLRSLTDDLVIIRPPRKWWRRFLSS